MLRGTAWRLKHQLQTQYTIHATSSVQPHPAPDPPHSRQRSLFEKTNLDPRQAPQRDPLAPSQASHSQPVPRRPPRPPHFEHGSRQRRPRDSIFSDSGRGLSRCPPATMTPCTVPSGASECARTGLVGLGTPSLLDCPCLSGILCGS